MNRSVLYWILQISGWFLFVLIIGTVIKLSEAVSQGTITNYDIISDMIIIFSSGIITTHIYRILIKKWQWVTKSAVKLTFLIIVGSVLCSILFHVLHSAFAYLIKNDFNLQIFSYVILANIASFSGVFFIWSLIYFLVNYFENYKKSEIENLTWKATIHEIELNTLKSQLNPHFMFNSMNTIRALVNENPEKAKDSITKLSNILRETLLLSKKKFITFKEELKIVNDFLDLEKTRYEERLNYYLDIDPNTYDIEIPPLMLQTIVENAIKHGISKIKEGGNVTVKANIANNLLNIEVVNSGTLIQITENEGLGIKNTKERLELLYGNKSSFKINNSENNTVKVNIIIPINQ